MAMAAGNVCKNRIERFAVIAPYIPAMIMQLRKNISASKPPVLTSPHIRPAARKPLYSPWLAASVADCLAKSSFKPNVFRPKGVVHRNISSTRNNTCRTMTMLMATVVNMSIVLRCFGLYFSCNIAEQDYSAYPYASPLQGLREKLFLIIFSAPTGKAFLVGAESCSAMFLARKSCPNCQMLFIR